MATQTRSTIAGLKPEDIGVLPTVVAQINSLADEPSTTAEQVATLILRDPTLTSKILRIVNSSYYGLRQVVRSISHAVAYLGINQIRNLVISSALIESFRFDHGVVDPRGVWEHSLGCAIGAKRLGDMIEEIDGDGAYLGGLLHDVGRIVLLSKFPDRYREVINNCERGLCTMRQAERAHFDISHEEAGQVLGEAWGFSEPVVAMIRHHHRPEEADSMAALAAAVGFANALCHQEGLRFGFDVDDQNADHEKHHAWEILVATQPDLDAEQMPEMEQRVVESIQKTKALVADLF